MSNIYITAKPMKIGLIIKKIKIKYDYTFLNTKICKIKMVPN